MTAFPRSTASTTRRTVPAQPRHLVDPVAGRGMPAAGPALCLSRLLDRREPENGLQGPFPGAGAADRGEWVPFARPEEQRKRYIRRRIDRFRCSQFDRHDHRHALIDRCSATCSAPRRCARRSARRRFSRAAPRSRRRWPALRRGSASCPADAAEAISQAAAAIAADPAALDLDRLKRETETVGYPILPLVRQLAERAGEAGAGCIGARRRRTSWIPPRCLQIRDGLDADRGRSRRGARPSGRHWRGAIATRRWPGAPICSTRCRSPSATRRRCGSPAFDRHAERLAELKPRVLVGAVRRRRRHAGLARRGRRRRSPPAPNWPANSVSPNRRSPGMSRATESSRPCSFWRCSAAVWAKSRST